MKLTIKKRPVWLSWLDGMKFEVREGGFCIAAFADCQLANDYRRRIERSRIAVEQSARAQLAANKRAQLKVVPA